MPQQEYDTCTGCGQMFKMDTEWFAYLIHKCERDSTPSKQEYEY